MWISARSPATLGIRVMVPLVAALSLARTASADEAAAPTQTVAAVWHVQTLDLNFSSFNVAYACSSLQSKIAGILRAVVAPEATKIGIRCSNFGMGTSATAKIMVASPIEATPQNVRALTTYDTRTQLVARVRSLELPSEEDIQRFSASWRSVSLARGKGLNLNAGDCDLVRSIRDQVLPHLAVKIERSSGMCGSRAPVLDVLALLPSEDPSLARVGE
jgi:hypothetical protein